MYFSKTMKNQFFPHTFWNICDGKIFSFTDISKSVREKLILHRFWKIQLFPVILPWIIYDNELKTIKYISPTKSIRRENLRQYFSLRNEIYQNNLDFCLIHASTWKFSFIRAGWFVWPKLWNSGVCLKLLNFRFVPSLFITTNHFTFVKLNNNYVLLFSYNVVLWNCKLLHVCKRICFLKKAVAKIFPTFCVWTF